jgi:hypothetical protein
MRIKNGDNIHTAIKKICENSTRAGSVIILLQREYPETALDFFKIIDSKGLYGQTLANFYFKDCDADMDLFLKKITDG